MPRWFNTPLQLHQRWRQTKSRSAQQHKRCIGGKYKLLHEIGQGASGIVHLAVDIKTNVRYAIKELNKSKLQRQYHSKLLGQTGPAGRRSRPTSTSSESTLDESFTVLGVTAQSKRRKLNETAHNNDPTLQDVFIEESKLLKTLAPHANIIKFIEVIEDSEYNDSVFIVMEYAENGIVMDMTPHAVIEPYSDTECRQIFKQLTRAVDHLHKNGIVHRDIKPQNLMFSNDKMIKLIDFGSATILSNSHNSTGTPAFMAPEMLRRGTQNQAQTSPACADLWSMGITLYCLAYGHLPFEKISILDLYSDIQHKSIAHSSINKIDDDLVDLIDRLLEKNPNKRITMESVMSHPWMKK